MRADIPDGALRGRLLQIVEGEEVYIPYVAQALCAGFPSPADDWIEGEIDLNRHLIANRPATFLFRVAGDCMRDAGIHDGDLLVVDRSLTPKHGDVVVAVVDDEISVKRLLVEDGVTRLVFQNSSWPAYPIPDMATVEIWGVATCALHPLHQTTAPAALAGSAREARR